MFEGPLLKLEAASPPHSTPLNSLNHTFLFDLLVTITIDDGQANYWICLTGLESPN